MSLTPKDHVGQVRQHQPIDRLPTQINYNQARGEKFATHYAPLANADSFAGFPWPNPHEPHLLDESAPTIAADNALVNKVAANGQHFIVPNFYFWLAPSTGIQFKVYRVLAAPGAGPFGYINKKKREMRNEKAFSNF